MSSSSRLALAGNDPPARSRAYLVVLRGPEAGRKFVLSAPVMVLGASEDADIYLSGALFDVRPRHASVYSDTQGVHVRDESDGVGVFVNDVKVDTALLRHMDTLRLGRMVLRFLSGPAADDAYHEEIYRLGTIDPMTGLFNRRSLDEALEREVERARRYMRPISLLLVDVDKMERINTDHGHGGGDFAVRAIGDVLRHRARKVDVVARLRGARFALLLPEVPGVGARAVGETMRALVSQQALMFSGRRISVTVTVGAATGGGDGVSVDGLLQDAERALVSGKAAGRDRVVGPDGGDEPA